MSSAILPLTQDPTAGQIKAGTSTYMPRKRLFRRLGFKKNAPIVNDFNLKVDRRVDKTERVEITGTIVSEYLQRADSTTFKILIMLSL
ncbi:hypothetical protein BGZ65_001375 [Modicella reniformis]|uniref:Uncharacterized protein n=1 Tax=Modicella reniformis TaxID=1440133 RepID=A0A9P6MA44_9FUNG|nr:hypothetical protein BGZ65_001375 [Modicella reniformis]